VDEESGLMMNNFRGKNSCPKDKCKIVVKISDVQRGENVAVAGCCNDAGHL
jgi:hypothetical protein